MQTHWSRLIVALCSIAILNCAGTRDVSKPVPSALPISSRTPVKVTVSGDEGIKSSVTSYLKNELISLGDVDIVDNNFRFQLSVLVMQTELAGFYKTGVVLSTVVLIPFDNSVLFNKFRAEYRNEGLQLTSRLYLEQDHWLNMGSPGDLEDLCKKIVAKFNTRVLEPFRKAVRQ
jgi:hypothetical protein